MSRAKVTLYSGSMTAPDVLAECRGLLVGTQPRAIELHTWRPDHYAPALRRLVPGVELSVGVGVDGEAKDVALGRQSCAAAVRELLRPEPMRWLVNQLLNEAARTENFIETSAPG